MIYNTSIYNMRENCLSHGHNDITFALEITCFLKDFMCEGGHTVIVNRIARFLTIKWLNYKSGKICNVLI